ncbi:MAG TPA: hypothetical protein PKB04_02620, partial [Phenylobacterium sp.]|nr:hypothetical protein [Phenylobacterium sp.]
MTPDDAGAAPYASPLLEKVARVAARQSALERQIVAAEAEGALVRTRLSAALLASLRAGDAARREAAAALVAAHRAASRINPRRRNRLARG